MIFQHLPWNKNLKLRQKFEKIANPPPPKKNPNQTSQPNKKAIINETALFQNHVLLLLTHLIFPIAGEQSIRLETLVYEELYRLDAQHYTHLLAQP